jgi:hypothetical protein
MYFNILAAWTVAVQWQLSEARPGVYRVASRPGVYRVPVTLLTSSRAKTKPRFEFQVLRAMLIFSLRMTKVLQCCH